MFKKNLYVFGCSFTKDNFQKIWADLVAENYNLNLINCAERGAGSAFVIKRLLTTKICPADSLVIIMWPSADRVDLWADHTVPHLLADQQYASWPDGRSPQLVDYYGHYNHVQGFNLNGSVPRGYKHYFYKYFYTAHLAVHDWFLNVITAQLYLKNKNINYIMTSAFPLLNPIHYHQDSFEIIKEIYQQIDLETFVYNAETQGFYNYCVDNKLSFQDLHHPDTQAHCNYVNNILKFKIDKLLENK
jgi:hypothetical protein